MPWNHVKNYPRILLMALCLAGAICAPVQAKAVVTSGAATPMPQLLQHAGRTTLMVDGN